MKNNLVIVVTMVLIIALAGLSIHTNLTLKYLGRENSLLEKKLFALAEEKTALTQDLLLAQKDILEETRLRQKAYNSLAGNVTELSGALRELSNKIGMLQADQDGLAGNMTKLGNNLFNPSEIYNKTSKALVTVYADLTGAGFVFGGGNLVVTAYHIVHGEPGDIVWVKPPNVGGVFWPRSLPGKIVKVKPEWDLALIELEEPLAEPLKPANARNLSVGEPVIIVGTPNGLESSISAGIISGFNRSFDGFFPSVKFTQFDASIYRGNSGGAVLNRAGEVIGMVNGSFEGSGFGFAVPVRYITDFLKEK
ncbi:MAG: trypsin-like peptidase domain-containing protein [Candidatus Nealsonbacteria bacterium]|nr:trypsin-like peptidase domain-containing protein [Candidatus Nealsonbacteria bacterium]